MSMRRTEWASFAAGQILEVPAAYLGGKEARMRPWMGHQEYVDAHSSASWSAGLVLLVVTGVLLIFYYIAVPLLQGH